MGGDEFVVILELGSGESPDTVADALASRIENAICQPIVVGSKEHLITVSIGYAVAGDDATADSLLGDADTAMYHVKSHGANGHRAFDPSLRRDTAHHDHTERQIRRALADGTLEVHYQPIVNPVTRLVHGVEALLRIPDANGMHLNTAEVIAVAEKTGLVSAIDDRVLEIASAQVASWHRDATLGPLMLTLNRSVRDITKPGFYDRIQHVLALSGLSPQALTLEITETVLLDADRAALTDLYDLHAQGINIAIDDFGTGYASLSYLTTLPISCIKIDRSFTDGLPADPTCATLVRATVGIAEDLGIDCVVEGVETPAQLASLPHYERLLVQGYLFGRPQPASQLAALLSAGGRLDAIA
jgi:EAL domain-containing protein (putative c-di-GMP-specific phosphodiesterase class I)